MSQPRLRIDWTNDEYRCAVAQQQARIAEAEFKRKIRREANQRSARYAFDKICDILDLNQKLYMDMETGKLHYLPNCPDAWVFYNLLYDFWTES